MELSSGDLFDYSLRYKFEYNHTSYYFIRGNYNIEKVQSFLYEIVL